MSLSLPHQYLDDLRMRRPRRGDDHPDRWSIGRARRSSSAASGGPNGRGARAEKRGGTELATGGPSQHPNETPSGANATDLSTLSILTSGITQEISDHVLRLLGSWGVLSDLSFSDMILVTP